MFPNDENCDPDPDQMPCPSPSGERLFWRPWPCAECGQGISPIGFLFGCTPTSSTVNTLSPEEIGRHESSLLLGWAQSCIHSDWKELAFRFLVSGSEHAVYLDKENATVYKVTLPGTFGEYYFLQDGKMAQEKSTPVEYLIRLHIWSKTFGVSPEALGITKDGRIVSSQPYITGETPSQEEVNSFLLQSSLEPIRQQYWLWMRPYEEFHVWFGDARKDNFVKTPSEIVPIDLRAWFMSKPI